jgi:hypothetical protein
MRTKVFLIPELCIFLLLVVSCSSYKAKESQDAASPQPSATAPPDTTASQPAAQSSAPPAAPSAPKSQAHKAAPPTESAAPVESAKETPTVAPPTPTPTPKPVVIPAGTDLRVRTTSPITTGEKATQKFEASLAKPIMVGNTVVVPKGALVSGTIPQAKSAGRIQGAGNLTLVLNSMTVKGKTYQIATKPVSLESKGRGKRSAVMIGGGSGAGALIGGLAGGGKGAAIGALAGAGAGTAGATLTGKRDIVIPAESFLNFTLSQKLVLPFVQGGGAESGTAEPESSGLKDRSPSTQSPQDTEPQPQQSPPAVQGSPTPHQQPPN